MPKHNYTDPDYSDATITGKKRRPIHTTETSINMDSSTGEIITTHDPSSLDSESSSSDLSSYVEEIPRACEEVSVNVNEIRAKLKSLKRHEATPIKKLSGHVKEDFDALVSYVAWMHNSDSYDYLCDEVKHYFTPTQQYKPGTVGAYCGGCLVNDKGNFKNKGCTVLCAGSIPPPYTDPDWEFCHELVIWASYTGNSYNFNTLNEVENNNNRALIFVEHASANNFRGFSLEEKEELRNHSIDYVKVVHYHPGNKKSMYIDITPDYTELDEIQTRDNSITEGGDGWSWWIFIGLVLILLIILSCACRYY